MRAFVLGFVPFLLVTAFARWYYVCKVHHLCGNEVPIEVPVSRTQDLDLIDEDTGETIIDDSEQFYFKKGNEKPDVSDKNAAFLDDVAGYLSEQPTKNLSITGHYLDSEKNIKKGYYENLGQARANEVRELLIERGIDEDRFAIDYDIVAGDALGKPLEFEVFENTTSGAASEGGTPYARQAFTFTNMTYSDANFAYNSDVFNPGEPFTIYADSVRIFLAQNPNKTLTIIGHTDFVGSDEYNDDLGQRRAESAKAYFVGLGVNNTINTLSMGKRQPVASNETDEGRQKNRRVNFKIE